MPIPDAIDLFLHTAAERPAQPALASRNRLMRFDEFEVRVREFAGAFARAPGPGILVALPQGPDAYAAMLGAGLAGAYYAPVNIEVPLEKLQRIAHSMRPDAIVADAEQFTALAPAAPGAARIDPQALAGAALQGSGSRHEIAYLIFTSGTTGTPKGVVIPRIALNHFVDWLRQSRTVVAGDRIAQFSNIAFDVSVTDIYRALCLGATLYPAIGRFDRTFPARLIARQKLTVWNSTPSVISLMMQAGEVTPAMLGSLRLLNSCGEPLLPTHLSAVFGTMPELVVQKSYILTRSTVTMTELKLTRSNYRPACGTSAARIRTRARS